MQTPIAYDSGESPNTSDTCCTDSVRSGVNCSGLLKWRKRCLCLESQELAYKFKQEGVLSESSDAASKAQDEHDPSYDNEEPHGVKAPKVCDRWQIGQHALKERKKESGYNSDCNSSKKINPA